MIVRTHKQYEKAWAKLSPSDKRRALAAIKLLLVSPSDKRLRLHQLKGSYYPHYSVSAGGDLRIHFLRADEHTIVLMLVGTHSQLYG